jgi:2-polyprenyl-3-methyl-5-hydroxy-6-metoxy-1,4-benzoquinol methylase
VYNPQAVLRMPEKIVPAATNDVPSWVSDVAAEKFINPLCPVCHTQDRSVLFTEGPYSICRCSACHLVFVTPQRTQEHLINDLYEERLWSSPAPRYFGYAAYREEEDAYINTFRLRWNNVRQRLPSGGKLLDVGCAAGYFMTVAREKGWQVRGVEPSETIATFGREKYGVDIVTGTLGDLNDPPQSYDLITLWDVIEHVSDPNALLRSAHTLLKNNGKLLIETQDVGSIFARLLGRRWHHFKHSEHLWHFNTATITKILLQNGYEVEYITTKGAGKVVNLGFIVERSVRVHSFLWRILSLIPASLRKKNVYVNMHDEMIVIARKNQGG